MKILEALKSPISHKFLRAVPIHKVQITKLKMKYLFSKSCLENSRVCYTLLESVTQKLCGKLRVYYRLLESVRRVLLGIMAGAYMENSSSKIPSIIFLCITCFQLFFLVLEKPFIKKNIELVEIMSVSSEACISVICFVLSEMELPAKDGTIVGVLLLMVFLVGFLPQMMNELYDLYKQIKLRDSAEKLFLTGLKLFISQEFLLSSWLPPRLKDNIANSNSQTTSAAWATPNDTPTDISAAVISSPNALEIESTVPPGSGEA